MYDQRDRKMGAYIGAAIGDAMGGPVEARHYKRIREVAGEVTGFLPYEPPYLLPERMRHPQGTFHPGYALHPDPGSVTDDTFCRKDVTRFILEAAPPRTPENLAAWLIEHGELDTQWPAIMLGALRRVHSGEVSARDCGLTYKQGGGIGWWFPIGIIHAGDPTAAAREGRLLASIWKAPLERDFVAAVVAGIADGLRDGATYESIMGAMLAQCGPLARALLERSMAIAGKARDIWDLAERLYHNILMPETAHIWEVTDQDPPTAVDAPLPPRHAPVVDTDERYTTYFFSEQIPMAVAAFTFKKGQPEAIPAACSLGRDADTNANTVGAWVGALHGLSALPADWVRKVCEVNKRELDLRDLAQRLSAHPA
jgi:ADP-ribosylglycohydrolase